METSMSSIELDSSAKYSAKRPDPVERSSEGASCHVDSPVYSLLSIVLLADDAAIAEAVAEVESELQRDSKDHETGSVMMKSALVAAVAVAIYFLKFR